MGPSKSTPAPPKLRDPVTAPFKPGSKPFDLAKAKAQARVQATKDARHAASLIAHGVLPPPPAPNVAPRQVAAAGGLPDPGHPFQGVTGSRAPAKAPAKAVPHATAQSALAKARLERLQQGGLLSPAQGAKESAAQSVVPTNLHYAPSPPQPASTAKAPVAPREPPRVAAQRAAQALQNAEGGFDWGGALNALKTGARVAYDPGSLLPAGPVTDALGYLNTTARVLAPNPNDIISYASGQAGREAKGAASVQSGLQSLADKLRPPAGAIPGTAVAMADLTPAARKALQKAGIAQPTLKQLAEQYGNGFLGPGLRKQLIDQAVTKQGWPNHDTKTWTDQDAASRAFNHYQHSLWGFVRNAAADIGSLSAGANIAPMVGGPLVSAAEGNPHDLIRTGASFADQWRKHLAIVGDRPILENLYNQPFTTFTSNVPILKGAGKLIGKRVVGLSPTREVTLPSTGRTVEVPATQNAITRPLTKASDAILARSQHPAARAQAPQPAGLNAELGMGVLQRAISRAGHRIEKGHAQSYLSGEHQRAILARGSEARHAQEGYLRAVRELPMTARDLVGRGKKVAAAEGGVTKVSDKQQRAEAIVFQSAVGKSGHEAARYYDIKANDTRAQMTKTDEAIAQAQDAVAQASDSVVHEIAQKRLSALEGTRHDLERELKSQEIAAQYVRAHPVDLANLHPKEKALVNAARHVSEVATKIKQEAPGGLGEQGTLYGDLQHNMEMTATLEPNTAAGRLATIALTHRDNLRTLEQQIGKLSDRRSPESSKMLGRIRVLSDTLKDIQGRRASVAARRERAQETLTRRSHAPVTVSTHGSAQEAQAAAAAHEAANPGHTASVRLVKGTGQLELRSTPPAGSPAEAAAASAGVRAGTVRAIVNEGRSALTAKKAREAVKLRAQERVLAEMETSQKQAHSTVATANLRRSERALQDAQNRTNSPIEKVAKDARREVEALTPHVDALKATLEHGYQPDERLAAQQTKVAKMQADQASIELSKGEMSAITKRHITAAQEKAIGDVALHDAVHAAEHKGADTELARLEGRAQKQLDEVSARYEALSGSKAEAALRHQDTAEQYVRAMKVYRQHIQDAGSPDPYHIPMNRPGDRVSAGTHVTQNELFPTGNYTHDIHIQLSADLEVNARAAVERELFSRAAQGPYVIQDPPPGSRIDPAYILTDAEALKSPRKPIYGPEENLDLLGEWKRQEDRRAAFEHVPTDGKRYALVARDAQDWIKETLRSHDFGENNPVLEGVLKFTNLYRRWMLFTLPRTLVNNALGNPILAAMGGAGIVDYVRAIDILRNHPELNPITQRGMGPIHNALTTQKLTGWQSTLRQMNVFHEDLGRLTVYMHHVIRAAKHEQGLKFYQRVDMGSEYMRSYLRDLAEGRNPDVVKFTDETTRWFGDMAKRGKWDNLLSTGVLFHRWVGHMIRLTLVTMPARYPGRTAFLLNLSHMADDYRKEHGLWPDWAKGIVGLFSTIDTVAGQPQKVIWGANTTGVMPFATPGQTFDFGSIASDRSPFAAIAAANINPLARILLEQGFGMRLDTLQPFKDEFGRPVSRFNWRLLANQVIGNTPILSTVFPRTGLADTAIQIDPNAPRRFSAAGAADPSYYPPIPTDQGTWWSLLLRALAGSGVSIRPVDAEGPRTKLSAAKAVSAIQRQAATNEANKLKTQAKRGKGPKPYGGKPAPWLKP